MSTKIAYMRVRLVAESALKQVFGHLHAVSSHWWLIQRLRWLHYLRIGRCRTGDRSTRTRITISYHRGWPDCFVLVLDNRIIVVFHFVTFSVQVVLRPLRRFHIPVRITLTTWSSKSFRRIIAILRIRFRNIIVSTCAFGYDFITFANYRWIIAVFFVVLDVNTDFRLFQTFQYFLPVALICENKDKN